MTKKNSTYERKIKDPNFKKAFNKSYKELLLSELIVAVMLDDDKSVRKLAAQTDISASVIQAIRSGKQTDIKVTNLLKIAHAFGYDLVLEKGEKRFCLHECTKNSQTYINAIFEPHKGHGGALAY